MVRYGVITWIPLYLFQNQNLIVEDIGKVGLKVCLIPIGGVIGTLVYNRIKVSRDVLIIVFLIFLVISFIIFPFTDGFFGNNRNVSGQFIPVWAPCLSGHYHAYTFR